MRKQNNKKNFLNNELQIHLKVIFLSCWEGIQSQNRVTCNKIVPDLRNHLTGSFLHVRKWGIEFKFFQNKGVASQTENKVQEKIGFYNSQ